MPAIYASSGLSPEENRRRFPSGPLVFTSLEEVLAGAARRAADIHAFEDETGITALDRIREFSKAASTSDPTLLGTGISAGLGGPIGGGIYAGIKDESLLTGLIALLASGMAAKGGAGIAHKGVTAALGRFAPLVERGMAGLRKGEKLVTPGAAGWDRALRFSKPLGGAAGAMAGTYGVSTLASQKSASDNPNTMSAIFYSIHRFNKIASQNVRPTQKKAGQLAMRAGGALARGASRFGAKAMKNVTPGLEMGGATAARSMAPFKQTLNMTPQLGLRDYLGRAGDFARRNPGATGAVAGAGAVAGYEGAYGRPMVKREGARLGAEGTLNQMSDYMGNAGLMQRLAFLLNPQGTSDMMRQQGLQQIMQQLG